MVAKHRHKRPDFRTVLILIGSFLLGFMLCSVLGLDRLPHQELISAVFTPVQTAVTTIGNGIGDLFGAVAGYPELKKENERLRAEILQQKLQAEKNYYLQYENEQLRSLLRLQEEHPDFTYVEAQVVSRSTDGWMCELSLNVGTAAGVKKGDLVVTGEGLVGLVREAGLNWSSVTYVADFRLSIGALLVRTGEIGYTEGNVSAMANGQWGLKALATDTLVNRGDLVVTSGLGGRYPKGLILGTVSDLKTEPDGLSVCAILTPAVEFSRVQKVFVLTNFEQEDPLS